ncbi:TPA: hypothetical protein ACH3X3_014542 [Trebouxia sp. C0006]
MLSRSRLTSPWLLLVGQRCLISTAPDFITSLCDPAAMLHGAGDLRFEDLPMADEVAPNHVRVQMRAVGICGSDVHFFKNGRMGSFEITEPLVVGHESAGEVVQAGSAVTSLKEGDRVALEPGIPCWSHKMSREGRYNLDPNIKFFSLPPVHGALRKYVDHPADFCFKLPDCLTFEQGALVEPLSIAVHACRRAGVGPGKKVAILGAGPIGLMMLAAAKAFSASSVAITDIRPGNLPVAQTLGAKYALDQSKAVSTAENVEAIRAVFPEGPDIVIDCVGFSSTVTTALQAVATGGTVVQVGLGQDTCCAPTMQTVFKEINFTGSWLYTNTFPLCISLLEEGKIQTEPLITHRLGFSEAEVLKGFQIASNSATTGAIKVMFSW